MLFIGVQEFIVDRITHYYCIFYWSTRKHETCMRRRIHAYEEERRCVSARVSVFIRLRTCVGERDLLWRKKRPTKEAVCSLFGNTRAHRRARTHTHTHMFFLPLSNLRSLYSTTPTHALLPGTPPCFSLVPRAPP